MIGPTGKMLVMHRATNAPLTNSLSDTFISKSGLALSIANCEHVIVQTSAQTCITIRSAALFVSKTGKLLETSAVEES